MRVREGALGACALRKRSDAYRVPERAPWSGAFASAEPRDARPVVAGDSRAQGPRSVGQAVEDPRELILVGAEKF